MKTEVQKQLMQNFGRNCITKETLAMRRMPLFHI